MYAETNMNINEMAYYARICKLVQQYVQTRFSKIMIFEKYTLYIYLSCNKQPVLKEHCTKFHHLLILSKFSLLSTFNEISKNTNLADRQTYHREMLTKWVLGM